MIETTAPEEANVVQTTAILAYEVSPCISVGDFFSDVSPPSIVSLVQPSQAYIIITILLLI